MNSSIASPLAGRWRLGGTFVSRGGLSSSICSYFGPVPDFSEEIKALPFQAWEGQVEANRTWIEVVSLVLRFRGLSACPTTSPRVRREGSGGG
jgi:hypothetical protein